MSRMSSVHTPTPHTRSQEHGRFWNTAEVVLYRSRQHAQHMVAESAVPEDEEDVDSSDDEDDSFPPMVPGVGVGAGAGAGAGASVATPVRLVSAASSSHSPPTPNRGDMSLSPV